jgi:thiosulfate reductase/polysulfide reductase chain A
MATLATNFVKGQTLTCKYPKHGRMNILKRHTGTIKALVTEFIHPESVFMVHGFGRKVPWQTRGYNKGLGDYRFETGLLNVYDPVGGANALLECFVKVEKAS